VQRFSGELLRQARIAAGKSREAVAVGIERSAQTVMLYELGHVDPPVEIVGRLAHLLGVEVSDLFERVEALA
jgi:DNA-binding XRE family transcriptional regulator